MITNCYYLYFGGRGGPYGVEAVGVEVDVDGG